jgi:hypothetical protein
MEISVQAKKVSLFEYHSRKVATIILYTLSESHTEILTDML